jgi:phospholipase/lecithinase/hemolysin
MSNVSRVSLPMTPAAMIAAPRHLWLATLGAAALTREWAERDAAAMFRSLVNEGTAVESRAVGVVSRSIGTSMTRANAIARDARTTVRSSVESLANAAATFVRTKVPTVRAKLAVEPARTTRKTPAKTAKRATRKTRRVAHTRAGK